MGTDTLKYLQPHSFSYYPELMIIGLGFNTDNSFAFQLSSVFTGPVQRPHYCTCNINPLINLKLRFLRYLNSFPLGHLVLRLEGADYHPSCFYAQLQTKTDAAISRCALRSCPWISKTGMRQWLCLREDRHKKMDWTGNVVLSAPSTTWANSQPRSAFLHPGQKCSEPSLDFPSWVEANWKSFSMFSPNFCHTWDFLFFFCSATTSESSHIYLSNFQLYTTLQGCEWVWNTQCSPHSNSMPVYATSAAEQSG